MKINEMKNIKVLPNTKKDLDKLKIHPRETYYDLIRRLVIDAQKLQKEEMQLKQIADSPQTQQDTKEV